MKGLLAVLLALVLGGCALRPAASHRSPGSSIPRSPTVAASKAPTGSIGAEAQRTHEVPTPAPRPAVAGGWHSPPEAVQAFAAAYVNWSYRTVALHLRVLSAVSVGQARSMLSMASVQVGRDSELRRGQITNSGVVEAIGPVRGHSDQYAVVTRERTTAANTNAYQGLAPAWHVALATVTRVRGLWVLSAWQPES